MKQLRRVHPLYYVALILFIVALVASALTADTSGGVSRSASVYDTGPGGTAALRNYLEAMGASTTTVQGDTFAADPSQVGVLFMLGPSETFTQFDVDAVRRFVTAGGTAVLATDAGILDGAVLDRFDLHVAGALGFVGVAFCLYLIASGRRLGPAIPLDPRPPRSSLEYIRGFAGLVRRSGHGEIARRRFRRELHGALARELGLDPETPFADIVAELSATDRERAARARALDESLGRPLRDEALLRTVREIGHITGARENGRR